MRHCLHCEQFICLNMHSLIESHHAAYSAQGRCCLSFPLTVVSLVVVAFTMHACRMHSLHENFPLNERRQGSATLPNHTFIKKKYFSSKKRTYFEERRGTALALFNHQNSFFSLLSVRSLNEKFQLLECCVRGFIFYANAFIFLRDRTPAKMVLI